MSFLKTFAAALITISLWSVYACNRPSEGQQLAQTHCGTCHHFPEPQLLDKASWRESVLPEMATKFGLLMVDGEAYPDVQKQADNSYASVSAISAEDWDKIVAYYVETAPEKLPLQQRPPIKKITTWFDVEAIGTPANSYPSESFIRINATQKQLWSANEGHLRIFDSQRKSVLSQAVEATIVDIDWTHNDATQRGYVTNIGILNPNNLAKGSVLPFSFHKKVTLDLSVIDSLPRPVQSLSADLNNDGLLDQLICGYGNDNGALLWYRNSGNNRYEKHILRNFPGAIKAYIDDVNHDGLPDIWVLFAQAQEGIYLFTNQGKGTFVEREALGFSPLSGSAYFELVDLNKDGFRDILYVSGDNADYTSKVLKFYHGIYGYLNDGQNNFRQLFFYPIHGCFKAIPRDFDEDGDMDIVAISYFPDYEKQPQEGIVLLENKGNFRFDATTVKEVTAGQWLVMDTGDIDGDGDVDVVVGNFDRHKRGKRVAAPTDTSILVLRNKLRHP